MKSEVRLGSRGGAAYDNLLAVLAERMQKDNALLDALLVKVVGALNVLIEKRGERGYDILGL